MVLGARHQQGLLKPQRGNYNQCAATSLQSITMLLAHCVPNDC
jgi:hypothetical protein